MYNLFIRTKTTQQEVMRILDHPSRGGAVWTTPAIGRTLPSQQPYWNKNQGPEA